MSFRTNFDKVRIGNMALSNLGSRSTITSFSENSAEAQQVNLWYDWARVETLQAFNWSFARRRTDLIEATDLPPEGVWLYRYADLTDMVTLRYLNNPAGPDADAVPFDIEMDDAGRKTVLTNLEEATAVYTADVENVIRFTPLFVTALSYILAAHMCISLTGDKALKTEMERNFIITVMQAQAADANEKVEVKPRDPETIRGRN